MKVKYAVLVLVCALAIILGGCGKKQEDENTDKSDNQHRTAVVFGDSYFNNPTVGYEFGDWLAENGPYAKVYNHAYEGSGFGNTYKYRQGYSLYELLITGTGTTPDGKTAYEDVRRHVRKADVIYIHLGGNDFLSAADSGLTAPILEETDIRSKVRSVLNEIDRLNSHAVVYFVPPATMEELANVTGSKMNLGDTDENWLKRIKVVRDIYVAIAESNANVYIGEQVLSRLTYKCADSMHPTKEMSNIVFQQILNMKFRSKLLREMLVVVDSTMSPDSAELSWTKTVSKDLFDDTKLFYIINNDGLFAISSQQALYGNTSVWDVMTVLNSSFSVGKFRWDDGLTYTPDGLFSLYEQSPAG